MNVENEEPGGPGASDEHIEVEICDLVPAQGSSLTGGQRRRHASFE